MKEQEKYKKLAGKMRLCNGWVSDLTGQAREPCYNTGKHATRRSRLTGFLWSVPGLF